MICPTGETEYFFGREWTVESALIWFAEFDFWRRRFVVSRIVHCDVHFASRATRLPCSSGSTRRVMSAISAPHLRCRRYPRQPTLRRVSGPAASGQEQTSTGLLDHAVATRARTLVRESGSIWSQLSLTFSDRRRFGPVGLNASRLGGRYLDPRTLSATAYSHIRSRCRRL
jgi:hypothetical protein